MIQYQAALEILESVARTHQAAAEWVSTQQACGRILAEDVLSPEAVPSFDNSAMDGFAVFASDTILATTETPVWIPVNGLVAAGDHQACENARAQAAGQGIEIMTGAPLPQGGYDAVVRIEDVQVERTPAGLATSISLKRPVSPGSNLRRQGTDFTVGQRVLSQGTRFTEEHILACASLGISQIKVRGLPKVAILSTGSELVAPEEKHLPAGKIRNSTGPFLLAALRRLGIQAEYFGVIPDDASLYRKRLEQLLQDGTDLFISTGAVSMGKYDFVSDVITDMGAKIHFHKSSIRPGKPILFAELSHHGRKHAFFGIPGNPVSTAVGLRFFIEPYLRGHLGLPRETPFVGKLSTEMSKPEGLRCFFKGRSTLGESGLEALALKGQASYLVSSMCEANCWVVFPESNSSLKAGAPVDIYPLQNSFERGILS
jgi:molybdopterin molybdotransferase